MTDTLRREDYRLLAGQGEFAADRHVPGAAHAVFLRADRPHARIGRIDADAARAMSGVAAVFVGGELEAPGRFWVQAASDGVVSPLRVPPRPLLARDRVRFVGEAVALVVAETEARARDAAEAIRVEYEDLPALTDAFVASSPGAPQVYGDIPHNVCYAQSHGDATATDAAMRAAAHVVRLALINNRIVPGPLEPRAVTASFDVTGERGYTIALPTQGMPRMQQELADLLGVAPRQVRIVTGDVGGGFGVRTPAYPEYVALLLAARSLGRPVRWVSTRSEAFLADHHGRDGRLEGELGVDADGNFLAMRFRFAVNMGAQLTFKGVFIASTNPGRTMAGMYRTPALHMLVRCVLTNTPVIGPYRGSGRPEIAFLVERLVDEAAWVLKRDRVDLRRQNLIPVMPWKTPAGVTYENGDFRAVLERAVALADWAGFGARREAARSRGRLRGIGLACFVEATGGPPKEAAAIRVAADGSIALHVGTQSTGQGHETVLPAIVARRLGVPEGRVRLVQGDHDVGVDSGATIASRTLVAAGGAVVAVADAVIEKGRVLASRALEAAAADVEFEGGRYRIAGADRGIALAALLDGPGAPGEAHPLDADAQFLVATTYPNGCHVCEVEIDPETGEVRVERYTAVDDVGEVQDHAIVAGQIHGGVAQGIGQALFEHCRYDEAGQLLTGSYMDYAIPRADDLPAFVVAHHGTRERAHPLGAKGAGEAGATGAPGAVMNAVLDALRPLGVTHVDMPVRAYDTWRAIQEART